MILVWVGVEGLFIIPLIGAQKLESEERNLRVQKVHETDSKAARHVSPEYSEERGFIPCQTRPHHLKRDESEHSLT